MKKNRIVFLVLAVLVLFFSNTALAREIIWQGVSREHAPIRSVLVDSENPATLYIGTDKEVLKTEDEGMSWRPLLFVKGAKRGVNNLLFDPLDKNSLYACTGNGLYFGKKGGLPGREFLKEKIIWNKNAQAWLFSLLRAT